MPLWISHATPSYTHFSLCTLPSALYLITLSLKFSYKKKWKWIKSGRDHHLHRTIIDRTGEVENLSCFWLGQELGIDQGGRRGKWFWGVVAPQQKVSWGNTAHLLNPFPSPLPPPPSATYISVLTVSLAQHQPGLEKYPMFFVAIIFFLKFHPLKH